MNDDRDIPPGWIKYRVSAVYYPVLHMHIITKEGIGYFTVKSIQSGMIFSIAVTIYNSPYRVTGAGSGIGTFSEAGRLPGFHGA